MVFHTFVGGMVEHYLQQLVNSHTGNRRKKTMQVYQMLGFPGCLGCVCVNTRVCMSVCVWRVDVCLWACACVCIYGCVCISVCACLSICMYLCTYVFVSITACVNVCEGGMLYVRVGEVVAGDILCHGRGRMLPK